ncbi:MAG TPA: IclR family transcriptional regulator [Streptosporangiaceae bacterium]|jgi:DNA-binding IclR family transcriptional regulator
MKPLETVDRALQMLRAFDREHPDRSVGDLAAELGVHHSNASRLAATLALRGFLERTPDGERYRLGPELRRLGLLSLVERDLVGAAREPMRALVDDLGETVVLSQLDGDETVDIAQLTGAYVIGARQWLGRRSPLHATSDGKAFLAFADPPPALPRPLEPYTPFTVTDPDRLRREVADARERGWAGADSELEEGLCGVAAPVFDALGGCVAALNVTGPTFRLRESPDVPGPAGRLGPACRAAADAISARLGHSG